MQVLENNLPGVNQRLLKTESLAFSNLNGVWPYQNTIQNRIYGKNLIQQFDSPVKAIFQTFTPYGYFGGIFQTTDDISTAIWDQPDFEFPLTNAGTDFTIPPQLPIDSQGRTTGTGDIGSMGPTGLGGHGSRYENVYIDVPLLDYFITSIYYAAQTADLQQVLQNCSPTPSCIPFGYPPEPIFITPTIVNGLVPSNLFASIQGEAKEHIILNPSPPNNFLIVIDNSTIQATVIAVYNFTTLVNSLPATFQYATLLAHKNINGVGSDSEIPFTIPIDGANHTYNAHDYLSYSTPGYDPFPLVGDNFVQKITTVGYSDVNITHIRIYYLSLVQT